MSVKDAALCMVSMLIGNTWVLGFEVWLVEGQERFSRRLVSRRLCDAGVIWEQSAAAAES